MKANNNSICQLLLAIAALVLSSDVVAQTDIGKQVVRINVQGQWRGSNAIKEKNGTGFFVTEGFILTAAHVVGPKVQPTDGDVEWAEPPRITITYVQDNNALDQISSTSVSILYVDEQVDLALIGTTPIVGRSGLPLRNLRNFKTGQPIDVLAFGISRSQPTLVTIGSIDTPFNFSRSHRGAIDINVPGLEETDSGSPVLIDGQVIGVFTKGQRVTRSGDVASPISFAAPLLAMAGIDYPQPTIRDIIMTSSEADTVVQIQQLVNELKQEIVGFRYVVRTGNLIVTYQKRLESGWDPSSVRLRISPIFGTDVLPGFETALAPDDSQTKSGGGVIDDFDEQVEQYLQRYNQTASAMGQRQYQFNDLRMFRVVPTPVWDNAPPISGKEQDVAFVN